MPEETAITEDTPIEVATKGDITKNVLLINAGGTIVAERYLSGDPTKPPKRVTTLKGEQNPIRSLLRDSSLFPDHEKIDIYNFKKDLKHKDEEGHLVPINEEKHLVKDSQNIMPQDIRELANIIKNDNHSYVMVNSGTDRMVRNARWLEKALGETDKVVVFVGSMVPLSMDNTPESDGVSALKFALDRLIDSRKKVAAGVYIVGRNSEAAQKDPLSTEHTLFPVNTVEGKDFVRSTGRIEDNDEERYPRRFTLKPKLPIKPMPPRGARGDEEGAHQR